MSSEKVMLPVLERNHFHKKVEVLLVKVTRELHRERRVVLHTVQFQEI
jgi:hypothetical protein